MKLTIEEAFKILEKHLGIDLFVHKSQMSGQVYLHCETPPSNMTLIMVGEDFMGALNRLPEKYLECLKEMKDEQRTKGTISQD